METLAKFLADEPNGQTNHLSFLFDASLASIDPEKQEERSGVLAELQQFDAIVLCGSAALDSVRAAARLWHLIATSQQKRMVPLIVTGGVGHSTPVLYQAVANDLAKKDDDATKIVKETKSFFASSGSCMSGPEAAIFTLLLRYEFSIPAHSLFQEEESTNCGANAEKAMPLLVSRLQGLLKQRSAELMRVDGRDTAQQQQPLARIALLQDPTMQRRSRLSFEKHAPKFPQTLAPVLDFVSVCCPFEHPPRGKPSYPAARYNSLLLGEIPRLRNDENGYGPKGKGFIGECVIPAEVETAFAILNDEVAQTDDDEEKSRLILQK